MTTPSTARKAGPLLGNGLVTTFPFTFKVFAAGDIAVTVADSAGVETALVLDTHYSVALNGNQETSPGGTVTYPISGAPLPVGSVLAIVGDIDYDQPLDLPSGGNFSPMALENQLDRTTMQIQQLREELDRTAKLPPTSAESVADLVDDLQRRADSAGNIDIVAENVASVNVVAADLSEPVSEIETVAGSIGNVNVVGNNIGSVNTVAAGIAAVDTVATNMPSVVSAAEIDAVYQGAQAADPVVRDDGTPLQAGDLYFNTSSSRLRVFGGGAWHEGNAGSISVQTFSGTGVDTEFALSTAPQDEANTQIYISGVYQQKSEYSIAGSTLTFTTPPPLGADNIEVVIMSVLPVGEVNASGVSYAPALGAATSVQARLRAYEAVIGSSLIGHQSSKSGTVPTTLAVKAGERLSLTADFGGSPLLADNAPIFAVAGATGLPIYIPEGVFVTSVRPVGLYYGDGAISFNGEILALDKSVAQRYDTTLIGGGFTRLNTVVGANAAKNSPASAGAIAAFGHRALESSTSGGRKTAIGAGALCFNETGSYVEAVGADAGYAGTFQDRNTWIGNNSGKWAGTKDPVLYEHDFYGSIANLYGMDARWPTLRDDLVGQPFAPSVIATSTDDNSSNVSMGRNSLLHAIKSVSNAAIGYNAIAHGLNIKNSVAVGEGALRDGLIADYSVAIGSTAGTFTQSGVGTTAVGYAALKSNAHSRYNTAIGYRAMELFDPLSLVKPDTTDVGPRRNTAVGADAMRGASSGSFNTALGASALYNVSGSNNTGLGTGALTGLTTGSRNTALGQDAGGAQTTATNSVLIGYRAGYNNGGNQNVMIGTGSGELQTSGARNTYVGEEAGKLNQDGTDATARTNSVCLGYVARVSGDNQVQLGNSATTTYVYGTVQNRSDERDKTDLRDIDDVWDEFLMRHQVKQGRWDLREDYIQINDDGTIDYLPKDGSRARIRFHNWVIAQQVLEICDELNIDFGGLQHHAKNGGCDIYSIGYDEYIPLLIWFGQRNRHRIIEIEKRLNAAGI